MRTTAASAATACRHRNAHADYSPAHNKQNNKISTLKKRDNARQKTQYYNQLNMDDAELYQQSNKLQKRDALQCLKEYDKRFRWRSRERVLDIGCGDGGVTTEILRRFIPGDFVSLTGCDISDKMVRHATATHGTGDARIQFLQLDIAAELPPLLKGSFEHAFSFYTLHWIRDQDSAFNNIYELLSCGGECLLIFLGHMPLFDVFRTLARRRKWRQWLADVERFVSPYHDSQDPEKDIKRLMAKKGFKNIDVQIKEKNFIYSSLHDCKNAVSAVNPFKMPPAVEQEFLNDYIQLVRDMRLIDQANNNVDEAVNIKMNYTLIMAYGRKDEEIYEGVPLLQVLRKLA